MRHTILIAETSSMQHPLVAHMQKDAAQYELVVVKDGQQAIDYILSCQLPKPEIVLLDVSLPHGGAIEVVRAVRPLRPHLPMFMLTTSGALEMAIDTVKDLQHTLPEMLGRVGQAADVAQELSMLPLMDTNGNIRRMVEMEKELIRFALRHYNGHMSEVARRLGIGRSTLYRKIHDMGIQEDRMYVHAQA